MQRLAGITAVFALLAWSGCKDLEGSLPGNLTPDAYFRDVTVPDLPLPDPDLPRPDLPLPPDLIKQEDCKHLGQICQQDSDCGNGICVQVTAKFRVCSCTCFPDDTSLPGTEKHLCPTGFGDTCGKVTPVGRKTDWYCFKSCNPKLGANDCLAGVACHPRSGGDINVPGEAVCLIPGCAKDSDCPYSNGIVCDTKSKPCPTGQTCKAYAAGSTTGMCTAPGKCDIKSGLCDRQPKSKTGAKVGDPCKGDLDCADNMTCLVEVKGTNRNGYCTVDGCVFAKTLTMAACDSGSTCNRLYVGGRCLLKCDLKKATTCRGYAKDLLGDYECRAWSNLSIAGNPLASAPTCEPGPVMPCDMLKNSSMDCSSVGFISANDTNMSCRDLKNQKLANKHDPTGFCLDDTASGKVAP